MGRSRGRAAAPWVALAAVVVAVVVVTAVRSAPDDSPAARTRRLAELVRCPECRGLSVADSHEATSEAIRADIRRRVEAGESDDEILTVYADRYGEEILLEPEGGGLGIIAWGLPVAAVVLGGGGLLLALRRGRRAPPDDGEGDSAVAPARLRHPVAAIAGLIVFAGAAGSALALSVGDRGPGQGPTGASVPTSPDTSDTSYLETLRRAVEDSPDSYGARIGYARALLDGDPFEALKQYDTAAELAPDEAEPKAYGGWCLTVLALQAPAGDDRDVFVEGARARLDAAVETDTEYPDGHAFLGLLHLEALDDPGAAVPHLQRFLVLTPDGHPLRDQVLAALEDAVEASGVTTTVPNTGTTVP